MSRAGALWALMALQQGACVDPLMRSYRCSSAADCVEGFGCALASGGLACVAESQIVRPQEGWQEVLDGETSLLFDAATGLAWKAGASAAGLSWTAAEAACAGLDSAGLTGWRLPTLDELRALIVGCAATGAGGACQASTACAEVPACLANACFGCGATDGACYWSSALWGGACSLAHWSSTLVESEVVSAFTLSFATAEVRSAPLELQQTARCVWELPP